jgi:hypothetical protein
MRFRLSSLPWLPIAISVVLLASSSFAVQPIRDAATLEEVPEAFLDRPLSYVALAPLSNTLDMVTLMSAKQHIMVAAALVLVFVGVRVVKHRRGGSTWRQHGVALAWSIAGFVLTYVAAAALPRPMAALGVHDASVARVDFHSHTTASHDGRPGFDVERNRAWHRAAGFDIAIVTDHASVKSAEEGIVNNPVPAANGVTVIQGMEVTWNGEHVNIINAERGYKGLTTENKRDIDESALRLANVIPTREPVLIWNHPRDLGRLAMADTAGSPGVRGIELVNGAPDKMDLLRPRRAEIVRLAQRADVALTSGTDNHGWGYATPAWTIMYMANWRGASTDAIGQAIERSIREGGIRSTRVIERRVADPGDDPRGMLGAIVFVPARMLTTISNDERSVWLLWTWLIWTAAAWNRRRSARMAA